MSISTTDLLVELENFNAFDKETVVSSLNGIPVFTNEFWTSGQRAGHKLHEVSYRACYKPQLPEFFIDRLSRPGDLVLDPFSGRGTTAIEAARLGRRVAVNDVNPLSRALCEPRLSEQNAQEIEDRIREIIGCMPTTWQIEREDLLAFFHPTVLATIEFLRQEFMKRERAGRLDQIDRWIRMILINRLTGHSPGFLSVYTLPPNQAVTVDRQKLINLKRGQQPGLKDVAGILIKKTKALLSEGSISALEATFMTGASSDLRALGNGSVDLTVTSPPFLDVVDYKSDNWLRNWVIGEDSKDLAITQLRSIGDWTDFMKSSIAELARVTRPGGFAAIEVGEVRKSSVLLEEMVISAAAELPWRPVAVVINAQEFSKTSNVWRISNNDRGTNTNRIVVFERTGT
jgi:DNA modification methylase